MGHDNGRYDGIYQGGIEVNGDIGSSYYGYYLYVARMSGITSKMNALIAIMHVQWIVG
jgi:hypothetical protein